MVIDDFYSIPVVPADLPAITATEASESSPSEAVKDMLKAKSIYQAAGLQGSDDKDMWDACHAKVAGAEVDCSSSTRRRGVTLVAAPVRKRLAEALH